MSKSLTSNITALHKSAIFGHLVKVRCDFQFGLCYDAFVGKDAHCSLAMRRSVMPRPIEVGDIVTWRSAPNALGIANCKVLKLGEDEHGNPAALIDALGQQAGALIAHLHHE